MKIIGLLAALCLLVLPSSALAGTTATTTPAPQSAPKTPSVATPITTPAPARAGTNTAAAETQLAAKRRKKSKDSESTVEDCDAEDWAEEGGPTGECEGYKMGDDGVPYRPSKCGGVDAVIMFPMLGLIWIGGRLSRRRAGGDII